MSRLRIASTSCMSALLMVAFFIGPAPALADEYLAPEVVAEWNRVEFDLGNRKAEQAYTAKKTYEKVLIQGVKLDSRGNIYVSTARWGGPEVPATLSKLVKKGNAWKLQPYPNLAMNQVGKRRALQAVLGFEIDRNDVMWILDQGHIAGAPSKTGAEKLILWDIRKNREIQRYEFKDADSNKKCSFLNDIAVDNDSGFAYITDSGIFCDPLHGGLIVYDSKRNRARRVLDRTTFTNDAAGFQFRIDNRPVLKNTPMRTGADGVALTGDKKTVYWSNLTGNHLYAIDAALLRDFNISEAQLRSSVKHIATMPSNADGMTSDRDNNIYLTALMQNGLMRLDAESGKVSNFLSHPDMSWPDTLAWGPDGSLYIISNSLHIWVDGDMNFAKGSAPNFRLWRVPLKKRSYTVK